MGRFDVWGRLEKERVAIVASPLRFQGQWFDEETGLHYSLYRFYDPEVGRFICQDPLRLDAGVNLYEYAPNPLNYYDPLGISTGRVGNALAAVVATILSLVPGPIGEAAKNVQNMLTARVKAEEENRKRQEKVEKEQKQETKGRGREKPPPSEEQSSPSRRRGGRPSSPPFKPKVQPGARGQKPRSKEGKHKRLPRC
jgi:RHS repeat-associated protein